MSDIKELRRVYLEKKTRISAVGQRLPVYVFFGTWILLILLMAWLCITEFNAVFLALALVFALFAWVSFRSLSQMRKVFADENFMYVRHSKNMEEKVPLENIYAGSKPLIRLASALESVKFYYTSAEGEKKVVKFVPALMNQMYNQFIDLCSSKNPHIKIKRSLI